MKLFIMFTFVVLLATATVANVQDKVTKTAALIREMDSKLTVAMLHGDSASVDAMLADDYIEVNAQGVVSHKSDVMTTVRAQASAPRSTSIGPEIIVHETKVRVRGDTAILTSVTTTRYQFMENVGLPQAAPPASPVATDRQLLMKVYSRLNGRWQLMASQATAIAKL